MPKKELPKTYNPADCEDAIYKKWEQSGFFNPDNLALPKTAKSYTIVLPPPNITDKLHLGHAAMLAIEDLLIRYHRMKGERALWVPGTDHAAIATQNVVEKKLLKEEGKTRHDLGREEFLKKVWEFLKTTQTTILHQTRKMGASLDWSRQAFTLDEPREKAVRKLFVDMYNEGVIYRGVRVVNWCPRCQSTLADDEVEYKEEKGKLYWLKYGPFILATSRPETKLGDTAVAVYPGDKRYEKMVGKKYKIPGVLGEFEIIVVADRAVDPKFGSGAIKVTPAHDFTDYEIAQRHHLPMKQVINEQGRMMGNTGKYAGLTTREARAAILADMEKMGLIDHIEDGYIHNIASCYRCGTQIEPLPSKQWFVNVDKKLKRLGGRSLKEKAILAAENGQIEFIPGKFKKRYLDWMNNLHDWCVSRQIWFGHRVPVWHCGGRDKGKCLPECHQPIVSFETPKECPVCGSKDLIQDPDTLDTWFSSGTWTFSTLGWPWRKVWDLKIYDGKRIFETLKNCEKHFETRAGKPGGADKDWREFKIGDVINFSLVEEGSEKILSKEIVTKQIVSIQHFNSIDKLLGKIDVNEVHPYKPEEYRSWWEKRPYFNERIKKYGIWAFELKDPDLLRFHPTQVLETGYEIITLWVSRMIIMSFYALNEIPFEKVYLHGMILDKTGKKMSKSKGNGIDPLDMIAKFGTDAVRLSILMGNTPGNDARISEEKIASFRNFTNKLWNVARYIIEKSKVPPAPRLWRAGKSQKSKLQVKSQNFTLADEWILGKLEKMIKEATEDLENYKFSSAGEKLREFTWDDLADWYLEISKFEKNEAKAQILIYLLTELLKLWHPFMPFITEAIWSHFAKATRDKQEMGKKNLLMVEKWPITRKAQRITRNAIPLTPFIKGEKQQEFDVIKDLIVAIRNARAENKIEPARKVKAVIYAGKRAKLAQEQAALIKSLRTGLSELEVKVKGEKIVGAIYVAVGDIEIYLLGAVDSEKEKARLEKEISNLEKIIASAEARLANKEFTAKAPAQIVKKEKDKLAERRVELKKFKEQLKNL